MDGERGERMTELMRRRRALMMQTQKKPWEDTGITLQSFNRLSNTAEFDYNSTDKTLHIKSNGSRTWHGTNCNFTTNSGYEYKLEYDLTYISGTHLGGVRKSNNTMAENTGYVLESKHLRVNFQHNADIATLVLFDTFSTAQVGEMTYSNFSLQRRQL